MGTPYLYLGQLDKARQAYQNAQKYWHNFPNPSKEAIMLTNLSVTTCRLGQCQAMAVFSKGSIIKHYQAAQNYSNQSLIISEKLNKKRLLIVSLKALAASQLGLDNSDKAKANLNKSLEIQHHSQIDIYLADTYYILAQVAIEEKDYNQAIRLAKKVFIKIGNQGQGNKSKKGAAYRVLGQAYRLSGELDLAQEHLNSSLMVLKEITNPFETALTWRELALLHQEQGRLEEGKKLRQRFKLFLSRWGLSHQHHQKSELKQTFLSNSHLVLLTSLSPKQN